MFGIIRPCRHRLGAELYRAWQSHLCGLCLTLRAEHGQFARLATNYDGLLISAPVEAQAPEPEARRTAGPCPGRGMRTAPVVIGAGAKLAASAALVLAAAKTRDHVGDGDGVYARRPVAMVGTAIADRWQRQGAATGVGIGFDTAVLVGAVARQAAVERDAGPGTPLTVVTEPAETAAAAVLAHTAVLTGRPGNVAPLSEIGRHFARIAHLIDAIDDLDSDRARGAWNPITATGATVPHARSLCAASVDHVRSAVAAAAFRDSRLVERLLLHELPRAVASAGDPGSPLDLPMTKGEHADQRERHTDALFEGCCDGCCDGCCSGCGDCDCCCDGCGCDC